MLFIKIYYLLKFILEHPRKQDINKISYKQIVEILNYFKVTSIARI